MRSSTSPLSVRVLLISTGILTAAMTIKFCFPPVLNFAVDNTPVIWSVILSWLKPPFLYVIINGIIITIVASSRLLLNGEVEELPSESLLVPIQSSFDERECESPVKDSHVARSEVEDDELLISRSMWNQSRRMMKFLPVENVPSEFSFPVKEKPLVASRFASQRKMPKINTDGVRSLRVAKPRKHETLESTWKTITDGRHMPLNRHLRKPEIFENRYNHAPSSDVYSDEHATTSVVADYKLRKDRSLGQDELNRRVEAFIKKFNEEMRLQRQESLKRYMEMINRGAE